MSATLDGTCQLTGLLEGVNLVVRFFTPNTDTEIYKSFCSTDDGDFMIYGVPAGTYDVAIKADCCLSNLLEDIVFTEGQTTAEQDFGSLRSGDCKNDDADIGLPDRIVMYANWGQGGDCAGYAGDWLLPACPAGDGDGRGALYRQVGIGVQSL